MAEPGVMRVCVAVITFQRVDELRRCVAALLAGSRPGGCIVEHIIIDNDGERSAEPVARAAPVSPDLSLTYYLEHQRGIPYARNRAIAEAAKRGADVLLFVDDDEVPAPDWVATLVEAYRTSHAHLVGGPVLMSPSSDVPLPSWQSVVYRSTVAWVNRKAARSERRAQRGQTVTVVTNNWLAEMDFIAKNGLSFETKLAASGGSDTAFFHEALRLGARWSWCPGAVVYEVLPLARISLRYQFRRARAQSTNHFHQRHPEPTARTKASALTTAALRIAIGCVGTVVPFSGRASLVRSVRSIGWGFGRIDAVGGRLSRFYDTPQ